ncbi:MAG: YbaB/EbfC family nucleoid-associated protein [Treponema sp.]|jgi:DNA-binding YbaB/EbfC family protein|nr:YbaB/EbfC family nucleoid-associated protein [Treponema sp.]
MNINPFDILKNAQKIQEKMGSFQEKMVNISASGSAGGGMVEISLNGRMEILAVKISPEAMEDREMLQDLTAAAFNNAMEKIQEAINREMGTMTGGLGIPGFPGFGAPGQS